MKNCAPVFGAFAAAILALGGLIYMITTWISDNFGTEIAAGFWLMLFGAFMLFLGVLIAGMIQRWTLNGIVDFQAADDRGEVARQNVVREMIRGQREFDRDVRRAALPLAKQQAHVITERKQLEMQGKAAQDEAEWYALDEDNN